MGAESLGQARIQLPGARICVFRAHILQVRPFSSDGGVRTPPGEK
jgi:hypothetical protein